MQYLTDKLVSDTLTQFNLILFNVSALSILSKDESLIWRASSTPMQNILNGFEQKFLNLTQTFYFLPMNSCIKPVQILQLLCQILGLQSPHIQTLHRCG